MERSSTLRLLALSSIFALLAVFCAPLAQGQGTDATERYRAEGAVIETGQGPSGGLWFKVKVKIYDKETGKLAAEYLSFVGDVKESHTKAANGQAKAEADQADDIRLWPNPAEDEINLDWRGVSAKIGVKVLNMKGETVIETTLNTTKGRALDISALDMGIYFLCADDGEKVVTLKFVKE